MEFSYLVHVKSRNCTTVERYSFIQVCHVKKQLSYLVGIIFMSSLVSKISHLYKYI